MNQNTPDEHEQSLHNWRLQFNFAALERMMSIHFFSAGYEAAKAEYKQPIKTNKIKIEVGAHTPTIAEICSGI